MNAKILLIYTGGTIGMKADPESGALKPFDFNDIYEEFPYFRKLCVDLGVVNLVPIDSSDVTPELWRTMAEIIRDNYDAYDGFVVLHGTDTMSYSASALSFMLENLAKPVIFTGSQIPIGVLRTDGRENLMTAIEIAAASVNGGARVAEVALYFQNRLFRANRTTKHSAEQLNAFRSDNYPALADVGVTIHYNTEYIAPAPCKPFSIATQMDCNVLIVKLFPGLTHKLFATMLAMPLLRGVVLETFGSGNAPTAKWFISTLSEAIERGVIVMNVTQCEGGSVAMDMYQTGVELKKIGVVSGGDITTEAAVTKMMYLLGQGAENMDICRLLSVALRGEMS